jgi:hypothetical protein
MTATSTTATATTTTLPQMQLQFKLVEAEGKAKSGKAASGSPQLDQCLEDLKQNLPASMMADISVILANPKIFQLLKEAAGVLQALLVSFPFTFVTVDSFCL